MWPHCVTSACLVACPYLRVAGVKLAGRPRAAPIGRSHTSLFKSFSGDLMTMKTLLSTAALALITATSTASALTFKFSFENTSGAESGSLTGRIFGLSDNATGAASSIIIDSFPSAVGTLQAGNDVTLWNLQVFNSFTVLNGQITASSFAAQETAFPTNTFCLDASINCIGFTADQGSTGVSALVVQNGSNIANGGGFASITYTNISDVPLPAGGVLVMSGIAGLAGLKRRKKHAA